jgi:hypothetical protein
MSLFTRTGKEEVPEIQVQGEEAVIPTTESADEDNPKKVKLNLTTCLVCVIMSKDPLRFQSWRVPFELLRHVTESIATPVNTEDQGT